MAQESKSTTRAQRFGESGTSGQVIPFQSITASGTYICNWSGHLLRVPEDALTAGRSPLINILGPDELFVTKISDNPFVPVTKARLMASNLDVVVNF
ncbi:MAG: hypothetical protein IH895_00615 [Planctomycetes bacterium]|nr:hypothetical protein [Planctomycetota bacterium]